MKQKNRCKLKTFFPFFFILRPLFSTQVLRLQGYDLRTSFMASVQSSQISEIVVVGALLLAPLTESPVFETVAIGFATTTLIAHLVEDREQYIFDKIFSQYDLDSEKSYVPNDIENHVILAGYDWKTKDLEKGTIPPTEARINVSTTIPNRSS
ncbi:hypothetical protein HRED_08638 [Candidatus Haloredivivus sp. G17]|nr:hypothetical protein HRED_08638 [Candidatus Haloredivivus sp. G17]